MPRRSSIGNWQSTTNWTRRSTSGSSNRPWQSLTSQKGGPAGEGLDQVTHVVQGAEVVMGGGSAGGVGHGVTELARPGHVRGEGAVSREFTVTGLPRECCNCSPCCPRVANGPCCAL